MQDISNVTDVYFSNARECVEKDGDVTVTYAFFVRVPCMFAPRLFIEWLKEYCTENNISIEIKSAYEEGDLVPAGEPLLYLEGSYFHLSECETLLLQRLGAACVTTLNAYQLCSELPHIPFISMGARHCTGWEMQNMMDYAASVGSVAAKKEYHAKGFIGGASHATAHYFEKEEGMGTMPHALIGYYGSTLKAAQHFREYHPNKPFIVLNDYFGQEITDSLEVANYFKEEAERGELMFRLDTNGARYLEGLDYNKSIETIRENAPEMLKTHLSSRELKALYGQGVSAAAIWHFRKTLDQAGFPKVGIVASSGFNVIKCGIMKRAHAPIDIIGTGSFLPDYWSNTYATADIIKYGEDYRVKTGREYLIERYKSQKLRNIQND